MVLVVWKKLLFWTERITTLERQTDKSTWVEPKNAYYDLTKRKSVRKNIRIWAWWRPFSYNKWAYPVSLGWWNPIKGGETIVIVVGLQGLQSTTGIAGYTLIYNSYVMRLSSTEPLRAKNAIRNNTDILSTSVVFDDLNQKLNVKQTMVLFYKKYRWTKKIVKHIIKLLWV